MTGPHPIDEVTAYLKQAYANVTGGLGADPRMPTREQFDRSSMNLIGSLAPGEMVPVEGVAQHLRNAAFALRSALQSGGVDEAAIQAAKQRIVAAGLNPEHYGLTPQAAEFTAKRLLNEAQQWEKPFRASAVKSKLNGQTWEGVNHSAAQDLAVEQGQTNDIKNFIDGFMTHEGRFMPRQDALKLLQDRGLLPAARTMGPLSEELSGAPIQAAGILPFIMPTGGSSPDLQAALAHLRGNLTQPADATATGPRPQLPPLPTDSPVNNYDPTRTVDIVDSISNALHPRSAADSMAQRRSLFDAMQQGR